VVLGKKTKVENFEDPKENNSKENSISFLTSNNDSNKSNEEFKKKLLKYIQQDNIDNTKETEFENKNISSVQSSNTYISNDNEPNFESNVADISKFYKINYDNLNEKELKSTSIMDLNKENKVAEISIDQNCDTSRKSENIPDNWTYKGELPMNGGEMNGIFGFDSLESQFAIYNPNKLHLESSNDNNFNNIPHNDLRKPIVYEN